MPDTPLRNDASANDYIRIGKVPYDGSIYESNTSLASTGRATWRIYCHPTRPQTTLWDDLISIRVDTDTSAYDWPVGASLSASQKQLRVYRYNDLYDSDDATNVRNTRIVVDNYSPDTHTIYLKFRAYTFAYSTGTTV